MSPTPDEFDTFFDGVSRRLQGDKVAGRLAGEADLQAAAYCQLRERLEPEGYRVHNEWRLEEKDRRHYELDIGVADPKGNLWIAMEFKGIWKGRYEKAREDMGKLEDYFARRGTPGYNVQRGYFCFTSNATEPERVRKAVYPSSASEWTKGYLRIAEGFETAKLPWKVVRF